MDYKQQLREMRLGRGAENFIAFHEYLKGGCSGDDSHFFHLTSDKT